MKCLSLIVLATALASGACLARTISITGPNRAGMLEGETYSVSWSSSGVASVSVVATGVRTPMGGKSRGRFTVVMAQGVQDGQRSVDWKVPWIDAISFVAKIKGYDSSGKLVAQGKREYGFRPAVLAKRSADGLYLALQNRTNQRLYRQHNGRITRAYLSSSSENYNWRPKSSHPRAAHDHDGVYRILEKKRNHFSTIFRVDMPWAMRYHVGHFIHATSPRLYRNLGEPASGGCNRLTRVDAKEIYMMTPVGTRVEVIGPKG